jgi:serine protease Do
LACLAVLLSTAHSSAGAPVGFEDVVRDSMPSVVSVLTDAAIDRRSAHNGGGGQGSGFFLTAEGLVATNAHVVEDARRIAVVLPDGRQVAARVVGSDSATDLAVLRVEAPGPFRAVRWGDPDSLSPGAWVIAVGNPYGLGGSVSVGILSARGREIGSGPFDDYLQTDAAINRGNSGGPMFDVEGRVIGVNTAILSPTGGSVGIGFAISAAVARPALEALAAGRRFRRGFMAISVQDMTPALADALGLAEPRGALVSGVQPGGPAARAGMRAGDVLLSVGDMPVVGAAGLPRVVAGKEAGTEVGVVLWRDGRETTLSLRLGVRPDGEDRGPAPRPTLPPGAFPGRLGELGIRGQTLPSGAVGVQAVRPDSPMEAAGVSAGDVILAVDGRPVQGLDGLRRALAAPRPGRSHALLLLGSPEGERFAAVRTAP